MVSSANSGETTERERVTTSSHRSFCRGIYWDKPVLVGVLEIKIEVRFQP